MTKVVFDDICRDVLKCENYIEWKHDEEIYDGAQQYISYITCVSCTEVGQSYNIDTYPESCPHKTELDKYAAERIKEIKKFDRMMEQKRIWNRLNDI